MYHLILALEIRAFVSNGLNVLYLNSRSLKAFVSVGDDSAASKVCKITLLQQLVQRGDYDAVCVCETWLNNSVMDCELLSGYSIYRREKEGRVGGGVSVAIKTGLQVFRRLDLEKENIKLIVNEIKTANCNPVIFFIVFVVVGFQLCTSLQLSRESCSLKIKS